MNFLARRTVRRSFFDLHRPPERDFEQLLRLADMVKADVIWLGYGGISYPLLKYIKNYSDYRVVVDTDSVWSRFVLRGLSFAKTTEERQQIERQGKEKEEEERWGTQMADVTTAVSGVDADYFRGLAREPRQVHMFPNVIDADAYRSVPPPAEGIRSPSIYLAGSFFDATCPMVDAARWVIREVLPLVRKRIPSVHFYIVGKGSDRFLTDLRDPGVTVTGQIASVLPYLCHVEAALVPLRWESGTRFKILEAGACGTPVVSTTLGAEGLPVVHERDVLIADTPKSFADSVIRILEDRVLAARLAVSLRELVLRDFSIDSLAAQGRQILEYLSGNGKVGSTTDRLAKGAPDG
ncbi:MAG: glycosyltransferase family 4 protein [candidate division WOR-3 bacterium]|nr:glycosyltransferase family 4 protein [candidate division WOR-3 bacterium]